MRSLPEFTSDEDGTEEFDLATQVAILRRAVAELVLPKVASSARVARIGADLAVHCVLAQATVSSGAFVQLAERDVALATPRRVAETKLDRLGERLEKLQAQRPTSALIELLRRRLHSVLAELGQALAPRQDPNAQTELERALSMRRVVSDFQDAVLAEPAARENLPWALLVADTELAILLEHGAVSAGPAAERAELAALRSRVASYRRRCRSTDPRMTATLYSELVRPKVLAALSRKRDVKRHDERLLLELSALLTGRAPDMALAALAVDSLAALRGMDELLDRLIVELPFDPERVLALIARRVHQLRACALAS